MLKQLLTIILTAILLLSTAGAESNHYYDAIHSVSEPGYIAVQKGGLWGIVDHTGTLLIPCEWDEIDEIFEGKILVCREGLWGLIDLQGSILLPVEWDFVCDIVQSAYYAVERDGLYGLADSQGKLILPLGKGMVGEEWVDETSYIIRGTDVTTRQYYVIENGAAKEVQIQRPAAVHTIPEGYKTAYMVSTIGWWVESTTQPVHYRFADRQGNFLTEHIWDEVSGFYCGLSMVKKDGKVGFVNEAGEIAIPPVYDGAWSFSEDMTLVRLGSERFWIDAQGNRLFDWNWARGTRMHNGYAMVITADGLHGVIDKQGNQIIPCEWDEMEQYPFVWSEIISVEKDGLRGFLNKQGKLVTGQMYASEAIEAVCQEDTLFLLEDGILSIWSSGGEKIY